MLMNPAPNAERFARLASTPFARHANVAESIFRKWVRMIGARAERHRQRRALARLDDRLLDDIGISRSEAAVEIAKQFWQ